MSALLKPVPPPPAIDTEAVRAISAGLGEARVLLERRLDALATFDPSAVKDSRYTRLALDWSALPVAHPSHPDGPSPAEGADADAPQLRRLSLHLKENPTAAEALRGGASPWDPLTLAAWKEGASLVWKPGERAERAVYLAFSSPGGLVPEPLLLEVGAGAEASLFLRWTGEGEPSLHLSLLCGTVGPGASLKVFLLHEGGPSHHVLSVNMDLKADATVEWFGAWMGGKWTVVRQRAELAEPGASWRETEVVAGGGKEHFDWDSRVRHATRHTTSDVEAKTVLGGRARAVLTGNLLMEPEATGGSAHLGSHVLMLSPGARADSLPGLEIKSLDVKASHAASVGQVDEEQMLYLMSRGLDEAQARHAAVVGFLASLLERAPLPFAAQLLDPLLEAKITD